MLMLLFQVVDESWAIAATKVKDLMPLVSLQPYAGAGGLADSVLADSVLADRSVVNESVVNESVVNEGLADEASADEAVSHKRAVAPISGLLNYHGEHLPVVDVSQLVACQCAPSDLSTRIAIVELVAEGKAAPQNRGLILDRAYETAYLSNSVDLPVTSPYINATLKGPNGIVRQLAIASFC